MAAISFFNLMRPTTGLLTIFGVLIGAFIAIPSFGYPVLFGVLAAFLIASGGNVINDIFDYDIDRINKPKRPLPDGRLSIRAAWYFYVGLTITGLGLAWLVNPYFFGLAVFNAAVAFVYSKYLKRIALVGNVADAYLGAVTFPAGTLIFTGSLAFFVSGHPTFLLFFLAFSVLMARELMKDVEDIAGDHAQGARTLPVLIGVRRTVLLSQLFTFMGVALLVLSWRVFHFPIQAVPFFVVSLGLMVWSFFSGVVPAKRYLKYAMFAAALGFLMAGLVAGGFV